jgi:uncharacterized protein with PCYCGC motif
VRARRWREPTSGTSRSRALVGVSLLFVALGACSADQVTTDAIGDQIQTRAGGALPVFAGTGDTAELYRFARERGDVLRWIPCTCGCGQLGHASNRACYIAGEAGDRTTWTSHAAT